MVFQTYLHGTGYLSPTRYGKTITTCFALVVGAASALFIYQVYLNVSSYLKFDVATTAAFQHFAYGSKKTAVDFPAITLCSNNLFLASAVGYEWTSYNRWVGIPWFSAGEAYGLVEQISQAYLKTIAQSAISLLPQICKSPNASGVNVFVDALGLAAVMGDLGSAILMQQTCHNSVNSVLGCKWQGRWINCAHLFLNRMTDLGCGCFTFYPSVANVDSYVLLDADTATTLQSSIDAMLQSATANEMQQCFSSVNLTATPNCVAYTAAAKQAYTTQVFGASGAQIGAYNLTTSSAGSARTGLQLILNVQPEEYCIPGVAQAQNTLGFLAVVHDRNIAPFIQIAPATVELPAGFTVDVAINLIQITRETESLGKCVSKKPLRYYPNMATYSYDACITECVAEVYLTACTCVPFFAPPLMITTNGSNNMCPLTGEQCYLDLLHSRNFSGYPNIPVAYKYDSLAGLVGACDCPLQCEEIKYTVETSYVPLRSPATFRAMLPPGASVGVASNLTQFQKSFVVVNFFYKQLEYTLITETQAVVPMDVLNGIGGSFGFCLGGSLITVVELLVLLPCSFCRRKKTTRPNDGLTLNSQTQGRASRRLDDL